MSNLAYRSERGITQHPYQTDRSLLERELTTARASLQPVAVVEIMKTIREHFSELRVCQDST